MRLCSRHHSDCDVFVWTKEIVCLFVEKYDSSSFSYNFPTFNHIYV